MPRETELENTLVLIKPDGVKRQLIGEIITRFEKVGLKIVAMKMVQPTREMASEHYDEKIAKAHGEDIRKNLIEFLTSGPVVALLIHGTSAIAQVRKMIGTTEPANSPPGTIRGDFCHINYAGADSQNKAIENVIHASDSKESALREWNIWLENRDCCCYNTVHQIHTL